MARVLLTGATGFVGGRLAHTLRERGDDVSAIVRTPSPELDTIGVTQIDGGFDALSADVVAEHDAVVHAAASGDEDLEVARSVNQRATRQLAEHAQRAGIRYVHVSTTSVYDLVAIGDAEVDETAPLVSPGAAAPATGSAPSTYAVTKAEGEAEVARAAANGLSAAILRPPAVLGAGPTSTWGTRVPARLRDGSWDAPHPSTTYAWVHVDDLVEAIATAIDRRVDATVNVIGGQTTFGAYVDALRRVIADIPAEPGPREDARRWNGSYATDRLPELFGFHPSRSFDAAIDEIGAWWSTTTTS